MYLKMKKQFVLTLLLLFCVLISSRESVSQTIIEDLELSLTTDSTEIETSSKDKVKVSLKIKNTTQRTVKFTNIKVYLDLLGKDGEDCRSSGCFFAFIHLKTKKVKEQGPVKLISQEFIVVDAELDSIHWYSGMVSHFFPSTTKNLYDKAKPGEYYIYASVDVEATGRKDNGQFLQARSNKIKFIFR